ncbi:hypothetical protein HDU96_005495 [Phlyctochytrium bullatum]|nr:hypothetical protein HDU96_005495 [Phlyctochytrium bullatum]
MADEAGNAVDDGSDIQAVYYVVHGMGSQLEGVGRFAENLRNLRKTCAEVLVEEFGEAPPVSRMEWIPIEWHSIVHALETVDQRMRMISLPTTPVFRQINNDILADVLFFFSCFHGPKVLQIVANVLNKSHADFLEKYPGFKGDICIVGHSLGGIIMYDILANLHHAEEDPPGRTVPQEKTHYAISYPKLNFRPKFLFTLGSPLSAVLVMRGQSPTTYRMPDDIIYQNLFHLYDPLAYRTEPLVDPRYAEISPVLLQRPSSTTGNFNFRLDYYRSLSKLFASYMPSLPEMQIFPSLPEMQIFKTMSLPSILQIQFPQSLQLPSMPSFSSLGRARRYMVESVYSFAASSLLFGNTDEEELVRKRSFDSSSGESQGAREPSPVEPPRKRRRVTEKKPSTSNATTVPNRAIAVPKHTQRGRLKRKAKAKAEAEAEEAGAEASSSGLTETRSRSPSRRTSLMETAGTGVRGFFSKLKNFVLPANGDKDDEKEEMGPPGPPQPLSENEDESAMEKRKADVEDALTARLAEAAERALKKHPSTHSHHIQHNHSSVSLISDDKVQENGPDPESSAEDKPVEDETAQDEDAPLPLKHRTDYFVSENVMDNMVHQVLLYGLYPLTF